MQNSLTLIGILTFIISLTKMSFLAPLWEKTKPWSALLAPVVGIAIVLIQQHCWTIACIWTGITIGAGSIALHEILNIIKGIPGLNKIY